MYERCNHDAEQLRRPPTPDTLLARSSPKYVEIEYGPSKSFKLEMSEGETRESVIERSVEKIEAINNLQSQIDEIKRGGEPTQFISNKKVKTEHSSA